MISLSCRLAEDIQYGLAATLLHASGAWVSSDWPARPVSETAAPRWLGAALTYARRGLFRYERGINTYQRAIMPSAIRKRQRVPLAFCRRLAP